MPSGKSSSDQKVDDLEKHVDKLSDSIDSSRKEILQAIKDEDSSIEDKINALPTKEWVEKEMLKKQVDKINRSTNIRLTIAGIVITIVLAILNHL